MALLVYFLLFLALTGHSNALYCLCNAGMTDPALQKAIDYACGNGADCTPILQNGACYQPNTVKDHCNYAVNSYYQRKGNVQGSCDFAGVATTSQNLPSTSSGCVYPSSPSNAGTGSTTPSTGTTPGISPTTPSTGTGTGTGTVFGISPSSTTGTGTFNGAVLAHLEGRKTTLILPLVLTICFALRL